MIIDAPDFQILKKYYQTLEPYQYFQLYLDAHKKLLSLDDHKFEKMFKSPQELRTQMCFIQTATLAMTIPETRIMSIEEDLVPIMQDTKPDFTNLKLKYPAIFVNHQIKIKEGTLNGFLIVDYAQIERDHPDVSWITDEYRNQIRILVVGLDEKHQFEFYSINPVSETITKNRIHIEDNEEKNAMVKLSHKAIELACNLMNIIVNDEKDIQEIDIKVLPKQNEKRLKRGKQPMRDTTHLRLGGKLKKYAREYNECRNTMNVRYHVGGFFRHYISDRYKNMKNKKVFIKPFWKGMKNMPDVTNKYVHVTRGENDESSKN